MTRNEAHEAIINLYREMRATPSMERAAGLRKWMLLSQKTDSIFGAQTSTQIWIEAVAAAKRD